MLRCLQKTPIQFVFKKSRFPQQHTPEADVVVLTLTRIIKSVVTGQAPVTLEWRNTSGKKHKQNQKWYTHISCLTQFMPPPEKRNKVKSGVSLRCARCILAHTSHYSRLKKPDYTACPPEKTTVYHVYITRGTYRYAYARQTQVNWKKHKKIKKNDKKKKKREYKKRKKGKGKKAPYYQTLGAG